MPLHYQPFNLYTYLLINLVSIPRFGPLFISINLEVFVLLFESLFLQLSLLCHSGMEIIFVIQKDLYLPGQNQQGLIYIILIIIDQVQYSYYHGGSISYLHIGSTLITSTSTLLILYIYFVLLPVITRRYSFPF